MLRRRLNPLFAIACAIAVSACAHEPPAAKAAPPTAAAKKPDPAPDFPPPQATAKKGIYFHAPDGWQLMQPGKDAPDGTLAFLIHPGDAARPVIIISLMPWDDSITMKAAIPFLAEAVKKGGGAVSDIQTAEKRGSFRWTATVDKEKRAGKMTLLVLAGEDSHAFGFFGNWSAAADAEMTKTYEAFVSSAVIK